MLAGDFLKLVGIAFVISAPVAWFVMKRWLDDYAYRIDMGPGIFVLAAFAALLIVFASIGWQAIRAATSDPVKALRYE
jgi:putative ABC transport system permease protein